MIGIIGTSLANIEKMAFPKGKEISKKKFVSRNPFKNKVPARMLKHMCMRKCVRQNMSISRVQNDNVFFGVFQGDFAQRSL